MEREKAAQAIKAAAGKDEDYFNELVEYSSKIIHEVGYVLERFGGHTPIVDRPTYCQPKPENDATRKQKNWKVIQDYLDTVELVFQAFRSLKIKYCCTSAFCDKATSSFSRGLTYCIDATKKATSVVEDWCRAETQNNKAFQTCMLEKVIARKALDTKVLEDQAHTRAVLTQLHHDLLPIRLAAMERAKVAQAKKGGNGRDEINFNELVDYSSKIITEVGYVLERFGGHTPIVAVPAVGPAKTENDATRKQNNWKALQNYLNMVQTSFTVGSIDCYVIAFSQYIGHLRGINLSIFTRTVLLHLSHEDSQIIGRKLGVMERKEVALAQRGRAAIDEDYFIQLDRYSTKFSPTLEKCIRMKKVLTRGKSLLGAVILMTETAILKMTCQNWFGETATVVKLVLLSVLLIVTLSHFPSTSGICEASTSVFSRGLSYCTLATEIAKSLADSWVIKHSLAKLFSDVLRIRDGVAERRKVAQALGEAGGKDDDYFLEMDVYSTKILFETGYVFERFGGHRFRTTIPVAVQAKNENDATRKQNNWKELKDFMNTVQYAYDTFYYLEKKYCN
ncbi:hypothetical protein V9T40_006565 [Parthenolecanium corni]|uniref:Uncharacterized protein n=1 Tax=Parthenolecanium corni TaxID=536013 RepID=A0AAN9TK94_9HEMI